MSTPSNTSRPVTVITASYSGLGSELSKRLAREGHDLILINRSAAKMNAHIQELLQAAPAASIRGITADLSSHRDIRRAAADIAERFPHVDLLIHNAGALLDRPALSLQGNDMHYEVNTVAPFLLTGLLRPQLAAAKTAVVLAVGTSAIKMTRSLNVTELRKPAEFKKFAPYIQTKLATVAAFRALAADYAADGISLRVVDPGPAKTPMSQSAALPGWFRLFRPFFAQPDAGAGRIYAAATDPGFRGQSGIYIERGSVSRVPAPAQDAATQRELLALLQLTVEPEG